MNQLELVIVRDEGPTAFFATTIAETNLADHLVTTKNLGDEVGFSSKSTSDSILLQNLSDEHSRELKVDLACLEQIILNALIKLNLILCHILTKKLTECPNF